MAAVHTRGQDEKNIQIVNSTIPSGSMENTILPGDRIIGSRLSYLYHEPKRQDVVIFRFPDDESQVFIKRVIGLPGETLRIVDGRVYMNGSEKPLEEIYIKEVHSHDSRYWENHYVKKEDILAKAIFRYYPRLGKVE